MTPREQSMRIMELIDRHPDHRTISSIMQCSQGCARRLQEHMHAVDRAEQQGRIPRIGKP